MVDQPAEHRSGTIGVAFEKLQAGVPGKAEHVVSAADGQLDEVDGSAHLVGIPEPDRRRHCHMAEPVVRLRRDNLGCQLDHLIQAAFEPEQADLGVHGPALVLRLGVLEQWVIGLACPFDMHRVAGLDPADLLYEDRKEVRPHRFTKVELAQHGDGLVELAVFEEAAGVVPGHPNQ